MALRIYLTGRIDVETAAGLLDHRRFPGRQGRRAFAFLVCERGRPVPRDELAEAIWLEDLPPAWDVALSAVVSKQRALLRWIGLADPQALLTEFGCYQLRLPLDAWVDVEAAESSVDVAEGALRRGDTRQALTHATVCQVIARRVFLPGEEGRWVEARRARLRQILLRSLDCLADCWIAHGEWPLAVQVASEAVELEPFRDTGYQRLMRAHAAMGNRAEALRVYEQCRRLLVDELGTDPSPQTEALYLELLRLD